jgi:7,8-dihydropterin-6-yl-methyl-4-(beta-D-ribofuranosyl)aminobenzene 5'-phosphate synthase
LETREKPANKEFKIKEASNVEILSLVDNSVDFLSTISHKQVQSFGQWARERYGQEWLSTHTQFPFAEHGFSMLVRVFNEEKSESILFDTGGSPEAIGENAKRMGISLSEIGCIVMSHGHYDHFGGLLSVVKAVDKPGLPIIVHEDMFKIRGTAYSDGTTRKYTEFPTEAQLSPAHIIRTEQPFLMADNMVCITGEIPRETSFEKGLMRHKSFMNGSWQPDPHIRDDRAIIINAKEKGLVVLSGCAHAGIINTVAYAQQITGIANVYALIGGFHLAGKEFENRIEPTIEKLKQINPALIAPSHCTGWRAMCAIARTLPEAFVWNSVGNLYTL